MCAKLGSNRLNTVVFRAPYILPILRQYSWQNLVKQGGGDLPPPWKIQNRNQFVFLSFRVDPLYWLSFIEIGEMACSIPAWCTHGHTLNFSVNWLFCLLEDRNVDFFGWICNGNYVNEDLTYIMVSHFSLSICSSFVHLGSTSLSSCPCINFKMFFSTIWRTWSPRLRGWLFFWLWSGLLPIELQQLKHLHKAEQALKAL